MGWKAGWDVELTKNDLRQQEYCEGASPGKKCQPCFFFFFRLCFFFYMNIFGLNFLSLRTLTTEQTKNNPVFFPGGSWRQRGTKKDREDFCWGFNISL